MWRRPPTALTEDSAPRAARPSLLVGARRAEVGPRAVKWRFWISASKLTGAWDDQGGHKPGAEGRSAEKRGLLATPTQQRTSAAPQSAGAPAPCLSAPPVLFMFSMAACFRPWAQSKDQHWLPPTRKTRGEGLAEGVGHRSRSCGRIRLSISFASLKNVLASVKIHTTVATLRCQFRHVIATQLPQLSYALQFYNSNVARLRRMHLIGAVMLGNDVVHPALLLYSYVSPAFHHHNRCRFCW